MNLKQQIAGLFILILGALPATIGSAFLIIIFSMGVESLSNQFYIIGLALILFSIFGWGGTIGLWLSVFGILNKATVVFLILGSISILLLIILLVLEAHGEMLESDNINFMDIWFLCIPLIIALTQILSYFKKLNGKT